MKLKNDQIKLLADTVKGIGVAWIVGGIIAPLLRVEGPFPYAVMVMFGIGFGILCVSAALFILTFLEDDSNG